MTVRFPFPSIIASLLNVLYKEGGVDGLFEYTTTICLCLKTAEWPLEGISKTPCGTEKNFKSEDACTGVCV